MVFSSGAMSISSSDPKSRSTAPRNGALASAISAAVAPGGTGRRPPGGSGGGFGGFLSRLFTAGPAQAAEENPPSRDWDAHDFGPRMTVPFERLKGAKRYKVSELRFLDRGPLGEDARVTGADDPLFEGSALQPGGVFTRSQLLGELEALSSSGMFERVNVDAIRPQPDGTLGLTVAYAESLWAPAKHFSCVNVGGLVPSQSDETEDDDMTLREKMALQRRQEQEYQRRLRSATKPCILPEPVRGEVVQMVRKQGRVSARLLQRIRDHVLSWYHNEGFVCAQLVNFGNLHTGEVVGEVVEGEVTGVEYQFLDKLDNVIEGKTKLPVIDRELPQQVPETNSL
jgi:hypothetical protein